DAVTLYTAYGPTEPWYARPSVCHCARSLALVKSKSCCAPLPLQPTTAPPSAVAPRNPVPSIIASQRAFMAAALCSCHAAANPRIPVVRAGEARRRARTKESRLAAHARLRQTRRSERDYWVIASAICGGGADCAASSAAYCPGG